MNAFGELGRGRQCAVHPDRPAVVACTRCGDHACVACHDVSRQGDDLCATCMVAVVQHVASRADRLFAYLINVGVTVLVMFLPILPILLGDGQIYAVAALSAIALALMVFGFIALAGVNIYLLATRGQSIGKVALKIRIVADDGAPASLFTLLVLRLLIPLALSSLGGIFAIADALAIFRVDSRCIHDHIARTIVVKVNPGAPTAF